MVGDREQGGKVEVVHERGCTISYIRKQLFANLIVKHMKRQTNRLYYVQPTNLKTLPFINKELPKS